MKAQCLVLGALLCVQFVTAPIANAQIYTCQGPNGSRIFSDRKCGSDAKPVKGFEKTKAKSTRAVSKQPKPPVVVKPKEELAYLLESCNQGNEKSCMTWTMAGGPAALKEAEHQAELACEAGSLTDCEQRFCKEGANEKCRQSVLRAAELSGDNWYLRPVTDASSDESSDALVHAVRCIYKDESKTRDLKIVCRNGAKQSCAVPRTGPQFASLKLAANAQCAR